MLFPPAFHILHLPVFRVLFHLSVLCQPHWLWHIGKQPKNSSYVLLQAFHFMQQVFQLPFLNLCQIPYHTPPRRLHCSFSAIISILTFSAFLFLLPFHQILQCDFIHDIIYGIIHSFPDFNSYTVFTAFTFSIILHTGNRGETSLC